MHELTLYIAGSAQLLLLLFTSSCQSDDINFVYPIEPEILSVEVSPLQVQEFSDSLLFTISYRDGDGDIGWPEGDSLPLYIKDIRLPDADRFFISPQAPLGSQISIEGQLNVHLPNTFRLGTGSQEITRFEVWLTDRAGHQSNVVLTEEVVIYE